jgi:hypothetical protein
MQTGIDIELDEAAYFLRALAEAGKWGLEAEVVVFFLRLVREGKPTKEAADGALCEWDI